MQGFALRRGARLALRRLYRCTDGSKWRNELGDYHVVDGNMVVAKHVDPEKWGRELGVLKLFERVMYEAADGATESERYHVFYRGHGAFVIHDANHRPVSGQRSVRIFHTPDGAEKAARRLGGFDGHINPFVDNPDAATKACAAAYGYWLTERTAKG